MDFEKLRAQTIASTQDEEAVTVNTRALIDKVLARYSGEWTTLRELLQNAADAQASTVQIKFETIPSASVPLPSNSTDQSEILKHTLLNHTLRRLVVTNDGMAFGQNDWARLKRIAEGNPDETKIGAFGVGFYSVFADCEDPFVSSGNEAMAFYWKGNSLFTRRSQFEAGERSKDTSFVLNYRNTTSPVPSLLSLCQFLATSLTFVALQNIELWIDDWKILGLTKKASPSAELAIPRDVETKTKEGLMKVQSMERQSVQMDATFMNVVGWKPAVVPKSMGSDQYGSNPSDVPSLKSFFSRLTSRDNKQEAKNKKTAEEKAAQDHIDDKLTATTTANIFLRVTTANVKTFCSESFSAELERATKKPPPKTTKLSILTSSYDEVAASNGSTKSDLIAKTVDIWSSVLPTKKPGGRVFIGFPTHQTTGAGMHLSAPSLIPTVERESADLQARWVRNWNIEMLRVAGIMTRLAFTSEMTDLGESIKKAAELAGHGNKITKDEISRYMPEAQHILRTFTFSESTPSAQVSQIIEEAFWTTYRKPAIEIYSTRGVLLTSKVRMSSDDLSGFVDGIPVVPGELTQDKFIQKLQDFGLITEITTSDIKQELDGKSLNREQLIKFLNWAARKALAGDLALQTIRSLLGVTVATVGENEARGGIVSLSDIECFVDPKKIPREVPLPPNTLNHEITQSFSFHELQALGFSQLEIVPWLRFVDTLRGGKNAEEHDLSKNLKFAAQVLAILSKSWESLSMSSKATVTSLLQPATCIPTKSGMKKPQEAYFPSVKLFDDLPVVTGCPGVKDKVFAALGVRKTVELTVIFDRLLAPPAYEEKESDAKRWSHVDLIKYLTSVKDDIPAADMLRLKDARICPAENGPRSTSSPSARDSLFKISELYAPEDDLRQLGLPTLQWPGGAFRSNSPEGRFLWQLGLQKHPAVPLLVDMMASPDLALRSKAMSYFITHHAINQYDKFSLAESSKAFLPIEGDEKKLVSPTGCFTNEKVAVLNFPILRQELHPHAAKFGVSRDPPMPECVKRLLANPPKSRRDAIPLFSYFSSRHVELNQNDAARLGDATIVPITSRLGAEQVSQEKADLQVRFVSPRQCYLGDSESYKDIFDFVDFGQASNAFLLKCGAKHEPSKAEIAARVCHEPARMLSILKSPEKYLRLLSSLAGDMAMLKKDKNLWKQMKASRFLLASQDIKSSKQKSPPATEGSLDDDDDYEDRSIKQYSLAFPREIVILDDYTSYRLFREALLVCPEREVLEEFYLALGASNLSDLVEEDQRIGRLTDRQTSAQKLQKLVLERAKIFLYDHNPENIKHDAKWLEKNLTVKAVDSISLRKSLRNHQLSHTETRTVALTNESKNSWTPSSWTLWVTSKFDYFEVSMQISKLLLYRPKPQACLAFETLLGSDLYKLRARGYNVDRILKNKEAEAKLAEDNRRKVLEEEQAKMREEEELWRQQSQIANTSASNAVTAAARDHPESPERNIPGSFNDDTESRPGSRSSARNTLFGNFTKHFNNNDGHSHLGNLIRGIRGNNTQHIDSAPAADSDKPPPPYDDSGRPTQNHIDNGPERVTSPATLHNNLIKAVNASRAHDSASIFSQPNTTSVKEISSYCDSTPAHNIQFLANISNGMRLYIAKDLANEGTAFLRSNVDGLNSFAGMLKDIATVYSMPLTAMHVFYDEKGNSIAFNSKGSVFCNFRFFTQLHLNGLHGSGHDAAEKRIEAIAYWWSTVAHELAHNIVGPHGQEHSYYTEAFVTTYFAKMATKSMEFAAASPGPVSDTSGSSNAGTRTESHEGGSYKQMSLLDYSK